MSLLIILWLAIAAVVIVLIEILLGWLIADLISGFLHWLEDNHGREDWPLIGPLVIAPNRLHHANPAAFACGSSFLSRNGTGAAASLIIGALALAVFGPSLILAVAVLGGCVANEVHLYSHRPAQAPRWARQLQRLGLLQSMRHHAVHHRAPHQQAYCILTNWLNPVLDRIALWRRLDQLIAFMRSPH